LEQAAGISSDEKWFFFLREQALARPHAEAYDFYASVGFGTTTCKMRKPLAG
jgi:hypothetical protein